MDDLIKQSPEIEPRPTMTALQLYRILRNRPKPFRAIASKIEPGKAFLLDAKAKRLFNFYIDQETATALELFSKPA